MRELVTRLGVEVSEKLLTQAITHRSYSYENGGIPTNERLQRHLNNYYQNKFTSPFKDWELFYEIPCESDKQARLIEAHIKKMKSKYKTWEDCNVLREIKCLKKLEHSNIVKLR